MAHLRGQAAARGAILAAEKGDRGWRLGGGAAERERSDDPNGTRGVRATASDSQRVSIPSLQPRAQPRASPNTGEEYKHTVRPGLCHEESGDMRNAKGQVTTRDGGVPAQPPGLEAEALACRQSIPAALADGGFRPMPRTCAGPTYLKEFARLTSFSPATN